MSNEDKMKNIGIAVEAYSNAKVEYAHSEQMIRSIAKTYSNAASILGRRIGDNFTSPSEIMQSMGVPEDVIVGHERLAELLEQHNQKRLALSISLAQIRNLGLTIE
jgi:CII-binding regulator of phage lambda lysogenization HflD